ncbi:MAG: electron transport complex subunit RsxC [Gammaproteobacteria bacterium]
MSIERKLWHFHGGLKLPGHKSLSNSVPLDIAPLPSRLVHPLGQHIGSPSEPIVEVGETVMRGQPLSRATGYVCSPVHAASSGTVVSIAPHPVPHPSGLEAECVIIQTDGQDQPYDGYPPLSNYQTLNAPALRARVRECGIVGLGGAAFPTSVKLNAGVGMRLLILNGAECEPYISCDDSLMRYRAVEIIAGAQVMMHALEISQCCVAIEEDKPEAFDSLEAALNRSGDPRIQVTRVPAIYPEGGERQLIEVLTGKQVPAAGIPADIGMLCHNVGTAAAVARAVLYGEPLISRVITITGHGVAQARNLEARLGTPIADLIEYCGGYTDKARHLIMGGAMMGFSLASDSVPVIKASNCLLVGSTEDVEPRAASMPCIRCGECAQACPAQLLPQQLYWHARAEEFDKLEPFHLFDCIECGCCDVVCPSQIPLTQYFRFAKTEIWGRERERRQSDIARERFENRKSRLELAEAERKKRLEAKTRALKKSGSSAASKAAIEEVMARVRAKESAAAPKPRQEEPD